MAALGGGVLLALATSVPVVAEGSQDPVETALFPLPVEHRAGAGVYTWEGDAFRELRPSTNGLFCVTDTPDDERLSLQCHPLSLRPFVERQRLLRTRLGSAEVRVQIAAEIESGAITVPSGATSYWVSGNPDPDSGEYTSVRVWSEIAAPYATAKETGLPERNAGELLWLHHPGEYRAHIMVGYRTVPWEQVAGVE